MTRVSIIIPTFNATETINAAIDSTLAQRCEAAELIVVDDASTDETAEVVAEYGERLRFLRSPVNAGPAAARNEGIRLATGAWIAFLDADDVWTADGLHALLDGAEKHPKARIIQAAFQDVWPDGQDAPRYANRLPSTLFHHTVFDLVGLLNEDLRTGEDFDFWVRIKHHDLPIQRIDAAATLYRRRGDARADRVEAFYKMRMETLRRNLAATRGKPS